MHSSVSIFRRPVKDLCKISAKGFSSTVKPQINVKVDSENVRRQIARTVFDEKCPTSIRDLSQDDQRNMLHIQWDNDTKSRFLYVWLRDNCPESHTYNLSSNCKARIMVMNDLDVDIKPIDVQNLGDRIFLLWPDGKKSVYTSQWLKERNLDDADLRARRKLVHLDEKELWNSARLEQLQKWISFDELMNDDHTLHDGLFSLCKLGVIFIHNVPKSTGQLKKFSTRIGFEYLTHYGDFFTVKSDPNPSNVAYRSGALGFHSDLPYLQYAPQVQALHCIEQVKSKGGDNQMVDAFNVAQQMAEEYPPLYKILCTVPFEYIDDGKDFIRFDLTYNRPVFNFDSSGRLSEVHFSNQQRSWFYDVPIEMLHDVYRAQKVFNNLLNKPENCFELKLLPGQMIIFHNLRVLHARSAFKIGKDDGGRLLEGCYFNLDLIKSRIRVLRDQLNIQPNQISV